jgi:sugar phosphate isomerase/epimerase
MNYAISNIAWQQAQQEELLPFFQHSGIRGIEVAPSMVWPGWDGLNVASARGYAAALRDQGFEIPAMQAIFFGKQFGSIFAAENHAAILGHLEFIADIAAALGAGSVVFGSPGMRQRGALTPAQALEQALPLLHAAAQRFHQRGVYLCLEACSASYGCDFITNHAELLQLIATVDQPGFGLHIDAANLHENRERLADILAAGVPLRHFHISEPGLGGFQQAEGPHAANLATLRAAGYAGWASVEMRAGAEPLQQAGPWRYLPAA